MHHGVRARTTVRHGLGAALAVALCACAATLCAACGEPAAVDLSIDDASSLRLAKQLASLDGLGQRLESLEEDVQSIQRSIVALAEQNRTDIAAWKDEWADREAAYQAEVAEVEDYNATVARPEMKAAIINYFPEPGEPALTEIVKQEAIPPRPLPPAPTPPAAVNVDVDPVLRRIQSTRKLLRRLDAELASPASTSDTAGATSLTFVAVTDAERLLAVAAARSALRGAADRLERMLADIRRAVREGVTSDPLMGDVCKKELTKLGFSAVRAIEDARAALGMAAAENDVVAGLAWASATPPD